MDRYIINFLPTEGERVGTDVILQLYVFKCFLIKLQSQSWCFPEIHVLFHVADCIFLSHVNVFPPYMSIMFSFTSGMRV